MRLKLVQNHLVLLPGLDGTGKLFAPLTDSPANQFTTTVVSYPRDQLLHYDQLIPRIRGVMPWDQSYTLVAESFAGPLALKFAAAQPEYIKAIILVASFVSNPVHPLLEWTKFVVKDAWLEKPLPESLLKKFFLGQDASAAQVQNLVEALALVRPDVLAHRIRMAMDADVRNLLRTCEKPILYLAAKQDKILGKRGLEGIRSIKPGMTSVEIDGPHMLLQRKPVEAIEAIEKFMADQKLLNRPQPPEPQPLLESWEAKAA